MDRQSILEKYSFYRDGTPGFRSELEESSKVVSLAAGTTFCREGDRFAGFAMIGDGRIRVYKLGSTGRQITLYQVGEGETCLVDMLCNILNLPSPATAVIHADFQGLLIPQETFRRWIRDEESLRDYVFNTLSHRLVDLIALVEQVAFQKMDRRLAAFLLDHKAPGGTADPALETTHQAIAAELGSAREVISRLLEEFERRGGLSLARGRVTVTDPKILKSIAEDGA